MKKFAVILSGCGVYDGAEIQEAILTLLAIAKSGSEYKIFAPDIDQHHVINHITGEEMNENRNVLIESARIARGKIQPLHNFKAEDFDALIFPGGFGVAKNLSNLAFSGSDCSINADVVNAVNSMVTLKKPIGALCIAPAVISGIIKGAKVTIGNEQATINEIEKMGGEHKKTTHREIIIDEKYKLFTAPCYMLNASILDIEIETEKVVNAILDSLK